MDGAKDKKEQGKKRNGWWAHIGGAQNEHTEREPNGNGRS